MEFTQTDQERGKILVTLFEPCIQPLLDDSILSPLCFSPFSPPLLYFPALCLSSPTSPLATAPHTTHVDLCVSGSGRSQVVPSCSFDSSRELCPQRGCEEQAAEGTWKVQRDWARGSVPRTLHEFLCPGFKVQPYYQLRSLLHASSAYSSQHLGREKVSSVSIPFVYS